MELIPNSLPNNPQDSNSVPPLSRILREICIKYDLTEEDMRCWRRHGIISAARFEFYYRACSETTAHTTVIARVVDADPTSVTYGLTRYCQHHHLPHPRGWGVSHKASQHKKYHHGMSMMKRRADAAAKSYPKPTKTDRHKAALRAMRHDKLAQALIREGYKPTV